MTILLVCYFAFLLGFIFYSALGLYHLWRFGYVGDLTKPAMVVYILASVGVVILTVILMSLRIWSTNLI